MKRLSNPQAMAALNSTHTFDGDERLGTAVDGDTWLTPRYILDQLGEFDLDPCAADSNPNWVAPEQYTKKDNGLTSPWHGRVFVNPPFSNCVPWVFKHAEHRHGICLIPASVESVHWRKVVWQLAVGIYLLHGRTRFCNPDGSATRGRPLRSIALIAWTPRDREFLVKSTLAGVYISGGWHIR